MLDLYQIACEIFRKEKRSKKHFGWKTISKNYNISEYQARIVRHITNLFHQYGATIEDFETKYLQLKNKIKILEHKYKEVIKQNGENDDIYSLIEEVIKANKDKYFNFEVFDYFDEHNKNYEKHLSSKEKDYEEAVLLISDWHIGEYVNPESIGFINEFNEQIAEKRVKELFKKTLSIISIHRNHSRIEKLYIVALGDMVSGHNLHDELDKTNTLNVAEQILLTAKLISNLIFSFSKYFKQIEFIGIPGNHGRLTKKKEHKDPSNSFDYLVYKISEIEVTNAKHKIKNCKINFYVPKSYFVLKNILGYNFLFIHGDDIKVWNGIPFYGMLRDYTNKQEIFQAMHNVPINYVCMGHFHQPIVLNRPLGGIIVNGTLKGTCEYGLAKGFISKPSQTLFGVNEKYGKTFLYEIYLD